jgi:hypothetical protein
MKSRLSSALVAGSAAVFASTLALKAVDIVPHATAKGGLLRLMSSWLSPLLGQIGVVLRVSPSVMLAVPRPQKDCRPGASA